MADSTSGPLDSLYTKNFVIGIILSVCCGYIGLVLSLIGMLTAKDPLAKKNATICLIVSGVLLVLSHGLYFSGVLGGLVGR